MPVKSLDEIPVYEINSAPTLITPLVGNPVVDVKVMLVPDPPVPAVSSFKDPFNVFVIPEAPPKVEVPHPYPPVEDVGPTFS